MLSDGVSAVSAGISEKRQPFCRGSALLAMRPHRCICYQRVGLSVCPSVTFRCFVEMNEATIMRFSLSDSKTILVSREVKIDVADLKQRLVAAQSGLQQHVIDEAINKWRGRLRDCDS